jgi:excisionase family DNA binding protein
MSDERLLSPEDVARHVGLSRRAVYDAIRRGELGAMRLCGRLRIRPKDLDDWLDGAMVARPLPLPSVTEVRKRSRSTPATGSFRDLMEDGGGRTEEAA